MAIVLSTRDTIGVLRDIRAAVTGEVPLARKLAQETTLQTVGGTLTSMDGTLTTMDGTLTSMDGTLTTMDGRVASLDTKTPPLGQALSAASVPVVLASDYALATTPDRALIDAFGRQRVSNIVTIFDSKQVSDNQALYWDTSTTGTGAATYVAANACTVLSTAAAGDSVVRQTYRRFNYQPGKSQLIFMTGILRNTGTFSAGRVSRIGNHGDTAGVFFQYDATTGLAAGIRKNSVDTVIPQASWNLDRFDGTGPSGLVFSATATQIFVFNYEWLGVGSVWFGFVVAGTLIWAHRTDNSNVSLSVYMQTPNNPLRYEIVATAPGAGSMTAICASINSEGGNDPNGKVLSVCRTTIAQANVADVNPEKVILALRYRDSNASQVDIDILSVSVLSTGGTGEDNIATQLRNLTNTGPPVLTFSPIANSALEVALPADGPNEAFVVTDNMLGTSGTIIVAQYSTGNESVPSGPVRNAIRLGMSRAGVSDIIVLSVFPLSATPDMYGALTWREL